MAKKSVALFSVQDNKLLIPEENIDKLTDADKSKIAFYNNTLGYEVIFTKPEPKKRKTFTIAKATLYIEANNKKGLKAFKALKEDADKAAKSYKSLVAAKKDENSENAPTDEEVKSARKAMIVAQKDAFIAQKKFFIETYGEDAYEAVKEM